MDPIVVVPYDPAWPAVFAELAARLRAALGDVAVRIDHIGSTAVSGLAAKPIIDLQISVRSFEPFDAIGLPLERCGFRHRARNPDLTKRSFREQPGERRTHIHVRTDGSWSEQFALLFRDYLRVHPEAARDYAQLKYELASHLRDDREAYVEAKEPFIWQTMRAASDWSQRVGWSPGPSDA